MATDEIFISCLELNYTKAIKDFSEVDDIVYEFLESKFDSNQIEFIKHQYKISESFEQQFKKELEAYNNINGVE